MKCKKCEQEMHQIVPFADVKPEGQSATKWDGITKYQCTNEECENYERMIEIRAGEEPTNS